MKKTTADLLVSAAEDNDIDLEVYDNYSGRGMYGTKTCGVVGNLRDLIASVAIASREFKDEESYSHEDFVDDLQNMRTDNLGRDFIYY